MVDGVCQLHVVRTVEALQRWAADWQRLALARRSPICRFEWAEAVVTSLAPRDGHALRLFVVEREGHVTAIAPMQVKQRGVARVLEHLGIDEVYEPTDLLYETCDDLPLLLRGLRRSGMPFVLGRLPYDSPVGRYLAVCGGRPAWVRLLAVDHYPAIDLTQNPEGELNSGRRSDLRRMRRKAQEQGGWRSEMLRPSPHDVPALLERAIQIEGLSWKVNTGLALRQNHVVREFLAHYLPRVARNGILRMAFGYIGERPVAMQIALVCGGGYWLLKIGYDAAASGIAPGQLLMQDTLQSCVAEGLATYELMGTVAEWTRMWTKNDLPSWRAEIYPVGLGSAMALGSRISQWMITRFRQRMSKASAHGVR